ncbi:hypothetical protein [Rheinheimera nanhaiensis]|uniref:Integral membrane protein n=1 Tax=Rheinheimera nanhaiensis E407-8 TaxID=562729 RepID=I1DV95_9GAMM|nr:hypothetical protein [Rheinheimera nanhaiensis]GAB57973.1 hypothetical protein RNAN_0944 [Rheinheimera nanhaiensis E407-8]
MKRIEKFNILHLDGSAGFTVGILLLLFPNWFGDLYKLPISIILLLATANVCYGVYALWLAFSKQRTSASVALLAVANAAWFPVCIAIVLIYAQTASVVGLTFISLEALFVAFLSFYEWNNRHLLAKVCSTC